MPLSNREKFQGFKIQNTFIDKEILDQRRRMNSTINDKSELSFSEEMTNTQIKNSDIVLNYRDVDSVQDKRFIKRAGTYFLKSNK